MKRTKQPSPAGMEVRMAMFRQNITVKELARMIQKSEATVCEVISGKNRSEKTREMILDTLGLVTDASWDLEE